MFSFLTVFAPFLLESAQAKKGKFDTDTPDVVFVFESIDLLKHLQTRSEMKSEDEDDDKTMSEKSLFFNIGDKHVSSTPRGGEQSNYSTNIGDDSKDGLLSESSSLEIWTQMTEIIDVPESQAEINITNVVLEGDKTEFMSNLALQERENLTISVFLQQLPVELCKENVSVLRNADLKLFVRKEKAWNERNTVKRFGKRFFEKSKERGDELVEITDDNDTGDGWINTSGTEDNRGKTRCVICDEYVVDVKEHVKTHRPDIICEICGRKYHLKAHLVQHIFRVHKNLTR